MATENLLDSINYITMIFNHNLVAKAKEIKEMIKVGLRQK